MEKDILLNDISKSGIDRDKILFKHLSHLPHYVIPDQIMALTPDEIRESFSTWGSNGATFVPGQMFGRINS